MLRSSLFFLLIICNQAYAWENHANLTKIVLDDWVKHDTAAASYLNSQVKVETLNDFLQSTKNTLPIKLQEIEEWAKKNEQGYKSIPVNLAYQPNNTACAKDLDLCFKKAIRINLDVPLNPIIYDPVNAYSKQPHFSPVSDMHTIMPDYVAYHYNAMRFTRLLADAKVRVADVIATGSIQPDFGMDVFLYENSPTSFGKLYGFGLQPIADPTKAFNSQMLFHMATYHDDPRILTVVPRLAENYSEYRAHLYLSLSQFAKQTHHDYWANVFLGWGLHYVQDLTQPYHGKLANGLDTNQVLAALMEFSKNNYQPFAKIETVQVNRHIILENFTDYILSSSNNHGLYKRILYNSLIDNKFDNNFPAYDNNSLYLRNEVSLTTAKKAADYSVLLKKNIPALYINNPGFRVDTETNYANVFLHAMTEKQRLRFSKAISISLHQFGVYTRLCISALSSPS